MLGREFADIILFSEVNFDFAVGFELPGDLLVRGKTSDLRNIVAVGRFIGLKSIKA